MYDGWTDGWMYGWMDVSIDALWCVFSNARMAGMNEHVFPHTV